MSAQERYDAALKAALGYFEAAGYTVKDGQTDGSSRWRETGIPGEHWRQRLGDHPSFLMLKNASDALSTIGFTLSINDITEAADLYQSYQSGVAELWAAAWGATPDPRYVSDLPQQGLHELL